MCLMPSKSLAVLALAGVALVGCSAKNEATAESTASATASVSETQSTASSSASSSEPEVSPLPTLANGEEVKLSDEERTAYEAGKYVPATETHPALNVPKPVMPELAKEQSFEGAKAFIEYWNEANNYAIQTGATSMAMDATGTEWKEHRALLDEVNKIYVIKNGWLSGASYQVEVPDYGYQAQMDNQVDIVVVLTRSTGVVYDQNGAVVEETGVFNKSSQPTTMTLGYEAGRWSVASSSGINGVDYE
ncbi:DUF6318 family protein [Rothia sp. ZJ932]|uniref:DUF6318 family protein n=1 Tax=Rothia sp. ZJ932 TaxID=2810516 RepID=UPI00196798A5|nr:DUF6318 family protein [Rothia sp. ZJ932]QRZ61646.1 hypothetical protein JR346_00385 [Rothia sp. ZJ932]